MKIFPVRFLSPYDKANNILNIMKDTSCKLNVNNSVQMAGQVCLKRSVKVINYYKEYLHALFRI